MPKNFKLVGGTKCPDCKGSGTAWKEPQKGYVEDWTKPKEIPTKIDCKTCNGNGKINTLNGCPECNTTGRKHGWVCHSCNGSGMKPLFPNSKERQAS